MGFFAEGDFTFLVSSLRGVGPTLRGVVPYGTESGRRLETENIKK